MLTTEKVMIRMCDISVYRTKSPAGSNCVRSTLTEQFPVILAAVMRLQTQ